MSRVFPANTGGLGQVWLRGQPTTAYLVDESRLRRGYRDSFLAGLERLYRRGELKLTGEFAELADAACWEALIRKLESTKWVVFIQPPPHEGCRPEHVVRYLGRYLTGGPISDHRLVRADDEHVVLWAREGTQAGGTANRVEVELTVVEFVRRWCLHVLPKGYVKGRRYGGLSNRHCADYLLRCQQLLSDHAPESSSSPCQSDTPEQEATAAPCCPGCGEAMQLVSSEFKPSWSTLRSLGLWPSWYQAQSAAGNPVSTGGPVPTANPAYCDTG